MENGTGNRTMQQGLIDEEFKEFIYACGNEGYEEELKELADLVYVCFQYAENMEWDLEEALDRVHKSNMSKLGLDVNLSVVVMARFLKDQITNHLI